jgi:hypothetical protein
MVTSIIIVKSTLIYEYDLWMQWLYVCMFCVHEAIKDPAELVTIVKPDKFCYCRYTYDVAGIKNISPPNPLITWHLIS